MRTYQLASNTNKPTVLEFVNRGLKQSKFH